MPKDPILYDLVLLLSAQADEDTRTNLVAEIESMIAAAGGNVSRKLAWGQRPTTYRINHQSEADYHLLQFTGPTSLLESLSHTTLRDRRRRAPLPDHQGRARHARGARECAADPRWCCRRDHRRR